jgi:hypothetical protein
MDVRTINRKKATLSTLIFGNEIIDPMFNSTTAHRDSASSASVLEVPRLGRSIVEWPRMPITFFLGSDPLYIR